MKKDIKSMFIIKRDANEVVPVQVEIKITIDRGFSVDWKSNLKCVIANIPGMLEYLVTKIFRHYQTTAMSLPKHDYRYIEGDINEILDDVVKGVNLENYYPIKDGGHETNSKQNHCYK